MKHFDKTEKVQKSKDNDNQVPSEVQSLPANMASKTGLAYPNNMHNIRICIGIAVEMYVHLFYTQINTFIGIILF